MDMAVVVRTNGIPFGVGAPPILVYFSSDWDVHGLLTHGHMEPLKNPRSEVPSTGCFWVVGFGRGKPSGTDYVLLTYQQMCVCQIGDPQNSGFPVGSLPQSVTKGAVKQTHTHRYACLGINAETFMAQACRGV